MHCRRRHYTILSCSVRAHIFLPNHNQSPACSPLYDRDAKAFSPPLCCTSCAEFCAAVTKLCDFRNSASILVSTTSTPGTPPGSNPSLQVPLPHPSPSSPHPHNQPQKCADVFSLVPQKKNMCLKSFLYACSSLPPNILNPKTRQQRASS